MSVGLHPFHECVGGGGGGVDGDASGVLDGAGFVFLEHADEDGDVLDGMEDLDGIADAAHGADDEFGFGRAGAFEEMFVAGVAAQDVDAEACEFAAHDGVVIDDEDVFSGFA